MKHGRYPYVGVSEGIKDFGDSLCVASLYPSTRIGDILHRFSVTGVLPSVGRAAIPADLVCGGEDFNSLRCRFDELHAEGYTDEQIAAYLNDTMSKTGSAAEPAAEPVAEPAAEPQKAPTEGQGGAPNNG